MNVSDRYTVRQITLPLNEHNIVQRPWLILVEARAVISVPCRLHAALVWIQRWTFSLLFEIIFKLRVDSGRFIVCVYLGNVRFPGVAPSPREADKLAWFARQRIHQ